MRSESAVRLAMVQILFGIGFVACGNVQSPQGDRGEVGGDWSSQAGGSGDVSEEAGSRHGGSGGSSAGRSRAGSSGDPQGGPSMTDEGAPSEGGDRGGKNLGGGGDTGAGGKKNGTGGSASLGQIGKDGGSVQRGGGFGSGGSRGIVDGGKSSFGGAAGVSSDGGAAVSGAEGGLSKTTIWIAGDSTVANGETPCPVGWGGQLGQYFNSQVTVQNSAAGGRSVRTWLYSVTSTMGSDGECVLRQDSSGTPVLQDAWKNMLTGMKSGDYLLIQFGINDGSATCDRHVGLSQFKTEYAMMAKAAKDRGTQPIFLTPVSAISCSGSTARGTRGDYVTATKDAGAEDGVPVIDLHELSVQLYNKLGFCPLPGGSDVSASTTGPVGDFFCEDHTHFEKAGAAQIAGRVAQALRDQNMGLAAYLK